MTHGFKILIFIVLLGQFSDASFPPKLPEYLYELCDVTSVNCLVGGESQDVGCLVNKNCRTMIAFEKADESNVFMFWTMTELTQDIAYVALGFSTDQEMGDDGVVECIQETKGGEPKIYLSYTEGKHAVTRLKDQQGFNASSMATENYLYCSFTLENHLNFESFNVSLEGDKEYYLFGVAGPANKEGENVIGVSKHSASKMISDRTFFKKSGDGGGSSISAYFFLIFALFILIKAY